MGDGRGPLRLSIEGVHRGMEDVLWGYRRGTAGMEGSSGEGRVPMGNGMGPVGV